MIKFSTMSSKVWQRKMTSWIIKIMNLIKSVRFLNSEVGVLINISVFQNLTLKKLIAAKKKRLHLKANFPEYPLIMAVTISISCFSYVIFSVL